MTTKKTTTYLSFPKEELKDLIEQDHSIDIFSHYLFIESFTLDEQSPGNSEIVIGENKKLEGGTDEVNTYTVLLSDLLTNILLAYNPDLTVGDILGVTDSVDQSKITVRY